MSTHIICFLGEKTINTVLVEEKKNLVWGYDKTVCILDKVSFPHHTFKIIWLVHSKLIFDWLTIKFIFDWFTVKLIGLQQNQHTVIWHRGLHLSGLSLSERTFSHGQCWQCRFYPNTSHIYIPLEYHSYPKSLNTIAFAKKGIQIYSCLFLKESICCWYSLEITGSSNEYPKHIFMEK